MRLGWIVLVVVVSATAGCYLFQSSETFYGLETAGQRVVFVIDISGSMEGKSEGSLQDQLTGAAVQTGGNALGDTIGGSVGRFVGQQTASEVTKLGGAKRELIPAIQGLPDASQFSIVTFGGETKPWLLGMVSANAKTKTVATGIIKDLAANGGTPALEALRKAFEYSELNMIFFLSDGQPTDSSAAQILQEVKALNSNRRVVVSTVGLGADQDEQFLTALAEQNGGRFVKK